MGPLVVSALKFGATDPRRSLASHQYQQIERSLCNTYGSGRPSAITSRIECDEDDVVPEFLVSHR